MKKQLATILLAGTLALGGCSANEAGSNEEAPAATTNTNGIGAGNDAPKVENWDAITEEYRQFAISQADTFVIETDKFVKAVKDGDVEGAKALYAPTRMYFERIEPIAEALGDFDPNIDARENDVEDKDWRGFHRIEKSLWEQGSTEGMDEYADRLLQDVQLLRALMETVEVKPAMLVTGAVELLNEVSSSKVTGEEERYSHTDLYDFAANVEGAKKIYELVQTELADHDAELNKQIGDAFANLEASLATYKNGEGYVSYLDLKQEDTKKLSQLLDALAEPLSQMGSILGA